MKLKDFIAKIKNTFKINYYKVQLENPINNSKNDIIGFETEVKRLKSSIKQGANLVAIISDFGAGKSSVIELLKSKLFFLKYKVVKINLWDNELSSFEKIKALGPNEKNIPSPRSNIKLHKSFLRQLSMQLRRYKAEYINKRINLNYGTAKISFPNYRSLLLWFTAYLLLIIVTVLLVSKNFFNINSLYLIDYNSKLAFINKIIDLFPTLLVLFLIIFIVFNKEVLFSFWNNSKDRNISEEDTIQLYNEIVTPLLPFRLRKLIIVIEDLDRIDNKELVKYYVNEFYRIYIEGNNRKSKSGITFIFCLKDEFLYEKSTPKEIPMNERYFIKLFDYVCNLSTIYINDYDEILKKLVYKDNFLRIKLDLKEINFNDLNWLTIGDNLNIRVIKNRLEIFKSIYLRINFKSNEIPKNEDLNLSVKMCAFSAFARSSYPRELFTILENYNNDSQNYIDKKIYQFLVEGEAKIDDVDENSSLKKHIIELINNKILDDDYKKYFYNIPFGVKVLTASQSKLISYIYEDEIPNNIIFDELDILIKNCDKDDFIINQLKKRINLGKGLPSLVFLNDTLFNNAKRNKEDLDKLAENLFVIKDINIDKICKWIIRIKESNIDKKTLSLYIKDYVNKSIQNINENEIDYNVLKRYRQHLLDCLGKEIINISELYKDYPIEEDEIKKIDDCNTLIQVCKYLSKEDQEKIMMNQFNEIVKLDSIDESINILTKECKNINLIFKVPKLDKLSILHKKNIYNYVINNLNINSTKVKIKLLNFLNFYDEKINHEIIGNLNNNVELEELYISYINKTEEFDDEAIKYFINISRIYKLTENNYNALAEVNKEKYLIYKSYSEGMLDTSLINNFRYLKGTFLKYNELINLFSENKIALEKLFKKKIYKQLNTNNNLKNKILTFSKVEQNKDIISYVLNNKDLNATDKAEYFSKINLIDLNASKFILDSLNQQRNQMPFKIKEAIYNNRKNIFKNLSPREKKSIARKLSNDIDIIK